MSWRSLIISNRSEKRNPCKRWNCSHTGCLGNDFSQALEVELWFLERQDWPHLDDQLAEGSVYNTIHMSTTQGNNCTFCLWSNKFNSLHCLEKLKFALNEKHMSLLYFGKIMFRSSQSCWLCIWSKCVIVRLWTSYMMTVYEHVSFWYHGLKS